LFSKTILKNINKNIYLSNKPSLFTYILLKFVYKKLLQIKSHNLPGFFFFFFFFFKANTKLEAEISYVLFLETPFKVGDGNSISEKITFYPFEV
jgi:hypothetical protein